MGNKRTELGITVSDEENYTVPNPKVLEKGKGDPGPDPKDREALPSRCSNRSSTSASTPG